MLPAGRLDEVELLTSLPACSIVCALCHKQSQSSATEDRRNYRPKHVELIGIINISLLSHLFGCLYFCISDARSNKYQK